MGCEGGYIRIQNKSRFKVQIKVVKGPRVDQRGLSDIQGLVAPGGQLPLEGETKFGGGTYEYIEGDVTTANPARRPLRAGSAPGG